MTTEIIPAAALSQHLAIVGRTGSGKTYAAKAAIVEPLLAAGKRVCILDPTGAWWGLKSSADGKHAGFPLVVIGGDHADLPLDESSGAPLAEMIAGGNLPCIIDLSDFGVGERNRFAAAFAEALLRKNRQPLHLIIDEADEFLPQGGGKEKNIDANVMLNRFDRIVRRGRRLGFRCVLISQRPAVLNKNALTQCATLVAMRLPAPQDRKAIEDWIHGQADESHAREVLGSLSGLKRGEGWLWFPEGGLLKRVQMPKIRTFDSSASPEDGDAVPEPQVLAKVDLERIGQSLKAAAAKLADEDPVRLREKIAGLQRDLAAAQQASRSAAQPEVKPVEVPILTESQIAGLRTLIGGIEALGGTIAASLQSMTDGARELSVALHRHYGHGRIPFPGIKHAGRDSLPHARQIGKPAATGVAPARRLPPGARDHSPDGFTPTGTQQRILDALAWYESLGERSPKLTKIGAVALIDPTGGHFSNVVGPLSSNGLVKRGYGSMSLTDAGRALANVPEAAGSLSDYHDVLRRRVRQMKSASGKTIEILDVVIAEGGNAISTEDIGMKIGVDHTGGHFSNTIGPLGTAGLITRKAGLVSPTDVLFPTGLS